MGKLRISAYPVPSYSEIYISRAIGFYFEKIVYIINCIGKLIINTPDGIIYINYIVPITPLKH